MILRIATRSGLRVDSERCGDTIRIANRTASTGDNVAAARDQGIVRTRGKIPGLLPRLCRW